MTRIAFGIPVFNEPASRLEKCMAGVRTHNPDAPIFVVADGVDRPDWRAVCDQYGAYFHFGARLKRVVYGAEWWERFLRLAASYDTDFVFKADPDARFHRPFGPMPAYEVFGSIERDYDVQGGVQGFARSAVRTLLTTGVCLDPLYRDLDRWAADRTKRYAAQTPGNQMSTDHTMAHMVMRLGLSWGAWPEVDCQWRQTRAFRDGVAATHPHKD